MHIKSLVLDGFKSYGKRVELNDFDPTFNAITGLNGTGKSNILDAICFSLGISAMNTIRVPTMQDVIYKSGQAGIHSATVTITFDNRDKSRSAPHYSHNDEIVISREVVMGAKNTFRINGVTVTAKKIMDFFNSLQMNVNNPHFIIMQGRITKVLNMKPAEILSMVEEAAGTNMYENKKRNLEMTVGKKDSKLNEMQTVADEEILPTMDTINKEKEMLEELNMVQGQLKKQKEKLDSWNYVQSKNHVMKFADEIAEIDDKIKDKKEILCKSKITCEELTKKIELVNSKMDSVDKIKLGKLKTEVEKSDKETRAIQLRVNEYENNIKIEGIKIKDVQKQINISQKELEAKKKEIEDFNNVNAGLEEENKKDQYDLDEIDKKITSLNSGNILADEDNGSVQENITRFNLDLQDQQTKNQQCAIKIDALKKKLNKHQTGVKEAQKAYDIQLSQLSSKQREHEKIKNEYLKANDELSQHNSLRSNRDSLLREIRKLNSKVESFQYDNSSLLFQYNDPQPGFDRQKVHGMICRLFKPIDMKYELALTTIAGGRFYFVVVDDDIIIKDILDTNKFVKRVNFIPLNKISSSSVKPDVIHTAQQIGGADNVFPAMSLIKFDNKHLNAIQWVFGNAFVCTTKEVAKKVCFDSRVSTNCYTLEGDHYNPAGNITGGTFTQQLVLQEIANQEEIISQVRAKKCELAQIDKKLAAMATLPEKVSELQEKQIKVQEELEKINSDINLGQACQQVTDVNSIKEQLVDLEKILTDGKINEKELQTKIKNLENQMKNAEKILKQQLSEAKKNRAAILAKIKNKKAENDGKKNKCNKLELEVKDLIGQMQEEESQLTELNANKDKLVSELTVFVSKLNAAKSILDGVTKEYEIQRETVVKSSFEIEKHESDRKHLCIKMKEYETQLKILEDEGEKLGENLIRAQEVSNKLDKKLSDDLKQMAQKMDYTNFNPNECGKSVNDLQERFSQLSNIVDPSKLNNFHKHIEEYKRLQKKLNIIMKDKTKINEIITELEVKKRQHLQRASDRVNDEFGKIFSSVLPGAQACLRQVNPNDITAGLEIRVAFNGLWKDSLDELSGGQRSLVALSLVLAMLLFNPVPLYILDEVDAALDLSHTQNIGKMLKRHFKQSQFIVVSLKDGMFSNANVLFRTKFVDGSSTVSRTTC